MVQYEMQRRASRVKGPVKASVGQATKQRVQVPQWFLTSGGSGVASAAKNTVPKNIQEVLAGTMVTQFLPVNPAPASRAHLRSKMGAVSTPPQSLQDAAAS